MCPLCPISMKGLTVAISPMKFRSPPLTWISGGWLKPRCGSATTMTLPETVFLPLTTKELDPSSRAPVRLVADQAATSLAVTSRAPADSASPCWAMQKFNPAAKASSRRRTSGGMLRYCASVSGRPCPARKIAGTMPLPRSCPCA